MQYYKDIKPSSIRILPMTSDEDLEPDFTDKSALEMHSYFFKNQLANDGEYQVRTKFEKTEDVFVLFKFDKTLVAAGYLKSYTPYPKEQKVKGNYRGVYKFDPVSIYIFNRISEKEFADEIEYTKFGRAMNYVDLKHWKALIALLEKKNARKP